MSVAAEESQYKNVVVIGAGVIGLTTALKIQEKGGYKVTIIAETLPSDPKSVKYTSLWAGAHHVSHAEGDPRQQKLDQDTFKVMWELSAPGGDAEQCFMRLPQEEYYIDHRDTHLNWMPDFKEIPKESLKAGTQWGVQFTTFTIDTPRYLNYLLSRFLARGGTIVRGSVQHIKQIAEGGPNVFSFNLAGRTPVDAIVVCAGIGARSLGGVEDKDVYPLRGQVVLIRAPWIKFGRTISNNEIGLWTYVIPRRSGDVVLGGTKLENDWYPVARPETTTDILERTFALCPELVSPEIRAQRAPIVDDIRPLIIEEGCGFRPGRKGGIRLEVDWIEAKKGKIPVVYNYGHSGQGYQSSWGSAFVAFDLLEQSLAEQT